VYATFNLGVNIVIWLLQLGVVLLMMGALTWLAVAYAANAAIRGSVRQARHSSALAGHATAAHAAAGPPSSRQQPRPAAAACEAGRMLRAALPAQLVPAQRDGVQAWLAGACGGCRQSSVDGTTPMDLLNNATANYTNVVTYYQKQVWQLLGQRAAGGLAGPLGCRLQAGWWCRRGRRRQRCPC
jgi:hypothetical protein